MTRRALPDITNGQLAELLARKAEESKTSQESVWLRAGRKALLWPEEAGSVLKSGRSLREFTGLGGMVLSQIKSWIESPPAPVECPAERSEFLTLAEARTLLAKNAGWRNRLKGDLQMHSTWSDGSASIATMAATGHGLGYRYIAITDHTAGLKVANGLDEKRLAAQAGEIKTLNQELRRQGLDFSILHSTEVNLSPQGEVDVKPAALRKLDIVLGSFHSALHLEADQTPRYLAALRNPHVQILGHPQTRVYNKRAGLRADWKRVFAEAAKLDKAVEVDGYADRQDLRLSLLRTARKEGARISLGTDSHHPWQMDPYMDLALAAVCKAKIDPERVLNFMGKDDLLAWADSVRA